MNKRFIIKFIVAIVALFIIVGALLPPLSTPLEHTQRITRLNSLKQIAIAILDYESEHGFLPPADQDGFSWRVTLLPYLGEKKLYDQIDKSVSWDHPNNLRFSESMPAVFTDPAKPTSTTTPYRLVSGAGTAWPSDGKRVNFSDVLDGISLTIGIVALPDNQTHWMATDSLSINDFLAIKRRSESNRICSSRLDGATYDVLPDNASELKSIFLIDDESKTSK